METRAVKVGSSSVALVSNTGRREFLKMALGASALALVGTTAVTKIAGAKVLDDSSHYRTTSALNLRQKPSTSAKILTVMPQGALVENLDEVSNGFVKVAYEGTGGWAHSNYLEVSNGGSAPPGEYIGDGITNDSVNFRTGPSTGHSVIQVLKKGTIVAMTDRIEYGFRVVKYNGKTGYVYDAYLDNYDGGGGNSGGDGSTKFKTTTAVNLRAKASTSSKILLVVPKGATVLDYDLVMSNGFRGVDYKGTVGWIYDDFLTEV
jgi:uncharacterized protein YgiM (DUF1202 family)